MILCLYPEEIHITALKDRTDVIVASDHFTDKEKNAYPCSRRFELPSWKDLPATFEKLRTLTEDITRVVPLGEYGVLPAALLNDYWRLKNGISLKAARLATNKLACRDALAKAWISVPRYMGAHGISEHTLKEFGYPFVLKTIASTLSQTVIKVNSPDGLSVRVGRMLVEAGTSPFVKRLYDFEKLMGLTDSASYEDPRKMFLVEEFAEGQASEVDGFVQTLHTEEVVFEMYPPTAQLWDNRLSFIMAYQHPMEMFAETLKRLTQKALTAIGHVEGGFSVEFRGAKVIEINARLPEDDGLLEMYAKSCLLHPVTGLLDGGRPEWAGKNFELMYNTDESKLNLEDLESAHKDFTLKEI